MKKPLVSICVPNYNYENFIVETLDSILEQTYENFEIIISDNASTDNSLEIINSYDDPRLKVYTNDENINLYENINKAISLSSGELIAVLHSDDKYAPDFLKKVVESYNKYPQERVFVTGVYNYHSDEDLIIPRCPYKTEGVKSNLEVMVKLQYINNIGNGASVVLHKECIEKVGMFSSNFRYASDYDFWLRLAEHFNFVYIPEMLAYYRIHGSNLTHKVSKNLDMIKEGFEILDFNMSKSKIIPNDMQEDIELLKCGAIYERAWKLGIKYASGKLVRDMLDCSAKRISKINNQGYCRVVKALSYLVFEDMPEPYLQTVRHLFRLALYPNKLFMEHYSKSMTFSSC